MIYISFQKGADLKVLHMSGVGLILGALFLLTTLLSLHTWTGDIRVFNHSINILEFFLNQGPFWVLTLFLPGPTPPWTPSPVSVQ